MTALSLVIGRISFGRSPSRGIAALSNITGTIGIRIRAQRRSPSRRSRPLPLSWYQRFRRSRNSSSQRGR
jgi:hypothetical protein